MTFLKYNTVQLVCIAFAVHMMLLYSIFDVYFTSPVIHNLQPIAPSSQPLSRRLVLFVADGLRADSVFHGDMAQTPTLKSLMQSRARWGWSHTRVPTESRPGHVALIAGFYEDVASVTKGWQSNAVEFDSVFNRSEHTWGWGSPDIVPMFQRGAVPGRVSVDVYDAAIEDFAANATWKLDQWVFNKFKVFFAEAKTNETLYKMLQNDKIVFFLHLLGLDTSGHSHKPGSPGFLVNLHEVDKGIREVEQIVNEFFHFDNQTAFLFTSDHGMTNWGSHGDGSEHETVTPLLAWGRGIHTGREYDFVTLPFQGPSVQLDKKFLSQNAFTSPPIAVWQADICPLMAALMGVPIPVNSVGRIPLAMLNVSGLEATRLLRDNSIQVVSQFKAKRLDKKLSTISIMFREFSEITASAVEEKLQTATKLSKAGKYNDSILVLNDLMDSALRGIEYFHKYHRFNLGLCIMLCFLAWVLLCLSEVGSSRSTNQITLAMISSNSWQNVTYALVMTLQLIWLLCEQRAWTHMLYHIVCCSLFWWLLHRLEELGRVLTLSLRSPLAWLVTLALMEILVLAFFYRRMLSYGVLLLGGLMPLFMQTRLLGKTCWMAWCIVLCVFPTLPVIASIHFAILIFGSLLTVFVACLFFHCMKPSMHYSQRIIFVFTLLQLVVSVFIVCCLRSDIRIPSGGTQMMQSISWVIIGSSFALPFAVRGSLQLKFVILSFSLCSVYVLLSLSYEVLFYLAIVMQSFIWMECSSVGKNSLSVTIQSQYGDIRQHLLTVITYVFLLYFCFFGTGNIASINSFNPTSVYCFVTVFNPFVMGALMLFKIVIPMVVVTAAYCIVQVAHGMDRRRQYYLLIAISDIVACHFFFFIRDWGSWLEIGSSISHYVIAMATCLFAFLLTSFTTRMLSLPAQPMNEESIQRIAIHAEMPVTHVKIS